MWLFSAVTWLKFREIATIKKLPVSKKLPPPGNFCFKMSSTSHLVFNQIIRNAWRTTASNMNAIQPTVCMISHPQAFQVAIFSKCPSSASLYVMESSQKLIKSLEMPRVPLHKIWMPSKQCFIRYRAYKFFRWIFFSKCPSSPSCF